MKGATCRQCGQQYAYAVPRGGIGSGRWLGGLAANRAIPVAFEQAADELNRPLGSEPGLAACPRCRQFPADMLAELRYRKLRRTLCYGSAIVGLAAEGLLLLTDGHSLSAAGVLSSAAAVLLAWLRASHRARRQAPVPCDPSPDAVPSRPRGVWTRQELEALASAHPTLDLTQPRLDWARGELRGQ